MILPTTIMLKASRIKLLGLDVDGVLTDGTVFFGGDELELKGFNVKDGYGIRALMDQGIEVAIITGRTSTAVTRRAKDLGITHLYQGVSDKQQVINQLVNSLNLRFAEIAFVGDDLPDLPVLRTVGLSVAVADAHADVCSRVDLITSLEGGRGAVREVADLLLKSQGKYSSHIYPSLES